MTDYLYRAKLVPIGQPVNIPTQPDRTPWLYTFSRHTFAIEAESKRVIPVCLDHDPQHVIGEVHTLRTIGDWWEATLKLGSETAAVGDPVSIGLQTLGIGSGVPFLTEVSLVPHGAVKGAEIIARYPAPSDRITKPGHELAQPTMTS